MTTPSPTDPKSGPLWSQSDTWLLLLNAALVAVAFILFNHRLPDHVAAHFNARGEEDRTMAKGSFWMFYAVLNIALPAAMTFTRKLDPRRSHYEKFRTYFVLIRWTLSLFLQGMFWMIILSELGYSVSISNFILGALGALWVVLGNRMGQVKSNYFIGIRTPWTLSDDEIWTRTHRLGGKLWFACGILMFVLAWFVPASQAVFVLLAFAVVSGLIPYGYSYLLYARKKGEG
jgi:uncharacterized membrane protein